MCSGCDPHAAEIGDGNPSQRTQRDGASRWRVGISHPFEPGRIATVICVEDGAIATSATYARGRHIVDPHTASPPEAFASVRIVGPGDLASADAHATAVFAMGAAGAAWAAGRIAPYEAFVVGDDGTVLFTPGLRARLEIGRACMASAGPSDPRTQ